MIFIKYMGSWFHPTHAILAITALCGVVIAVYAGTKGEASCQFGYDVGWKVHPCSLGPGTPLNSTCWEQSRSVSLGSYMGIYNVIVLFLQVLHVLWTLMIHRYSDDGKFEQHVRTSLSWFHTIHVLAIAIMSVFTISFWVSADMRHQCDTSLLIYTYFYTAFNIIHSMFIIGRILHIKTLEKKARNYLPE